MVVKKRNLRKLTLLGHSSTPVPSKPAPCVLEVFDNTHPDRPYEVLFKCPEFTSICPVTGQPDFGRLFIHYVPLKLCLESKSLKIYLLSFRNHGAFHEEVVNLVLDAIVKICAPRWAEIVGVFNPRGGIGIRVRAATGVPPNGVHPLTSSLISSGIEKVAE